MEKKIRKAMLVYQAGIANVFMVDCFNLSPYGRNARRLLQSDFNSCVMYARGLGMAGVIVRTVSCNLAGDIADSTWSDELESIPFSNSIVILHLG